MATDPGYIYAPFIPGVTAPTYIDPNDFSTRKGIRSRYASRFEEPSAVDQLAALADPTGEAAARVRAWKEWRSLITQRWAVYTDPLVESQRPAELLASASLRVRGG